MSIDNTILFRARAKIIQARLSTKLEKNYSTKDSANEDLFCGDVRKRINNFNDFSPGRFLSKLFSLLNRPQQRSEIFFFLLLGYFFEFLKNFHFFFFCSSREWNKQIFVKIFERQSLSIFM